MCKPNATINIELFKFWHYLVQKRENRAKDLYNKCLYLLEDFDVIKLLKYKKAEDSINQQYNKVKRILLKDFGTERLNELSYNFKNIIFNEYYNCYILEYALSGLIEISIKQYKLLRVYMLLKHIEFLSESQYEKVEYFIRRYITKEGKIKYCKLNYDISFVNASADKNILKQIRTSRK